MLTINQKGQTLVMFVLLIPLILMCAILVIDIGIVENKKNNLNNIVMSAVDYALDNYNEVKIKELIKKNDDKLNDITIKKENNKIIITIRKEVNGLFSSIININKYKLETIYEGEYINNQKIITKIKSQKV